MTSPAEDFKVLLEGESSLGLEFGVDLFVGDMPESPDACTGILDTGGQAPDPHKYYRTSVQILVRGAVGSYSETYDKANSILDVLQEYYGEPSGSTFYYTGIWAQGTPFYIGVDENERPLFSINFRAHRR